MATKSSKSDQPWQTTELWKLLLKHGKGNAPSRDTLQQLLTFLNTHLADANLLLGKGGTLTDYTLHDSGHAIRVATRMGQILSHSARRNLSPYELALLLLAAWLHDIGMVPAIALLQAHRDYLQFGDAPLDESQKLDFREFLDETRPDLPLPYPPANPAANALADTLVSAYARHRHNAWSTAWTRSHFHPINILPGDYLFLEDLILLCESHHWPISQIRGRDSLDPRRVGSPQQPLDLRYLACVLRTADILENDPERSPALLLGHRNVTSSSRLYWQRDHYLKIPPIAKGGRITLECHAQEAIIEKACRDLRAAIDHELDGCHTIALRGLFDTSRTLDWNLLPRTIWPYLGAKPYTYIDGTFRPDNDALLRLVAGEALYGTPLAAVRELLQNAFDAVREKIARQRLRLPLTDNPADPAWETRLGEKEQVTLTLESRPDGLYLICTDTGTGLTEGILKNRLLRSGQAPGHTHRELDRQCRAKGFTLGRTARFGIGCLSYFMLADEVTFTSRRDPLCNLPNDDPDLRPLRFHTQGFSEFGELRHLPPHENPAPGTTVTWKLKAEHTSDSTRFTEGLRDYLEENIIRVPCQFFVKISEKAKQHAPGWIPIVEENTLYVATDFHAWNYPATKSRPHQKSIKDLIKSINKEAKAIQYTPAETVGAEVEIEVLERYEMGFGWIRCKLPWIKFQGLEAMIWRLDEEDLDDSDDLTNRMYKGIFLNKKSRYSWFGMRCTLKRSHFKSSSMSYAIFSHQSDKNDQHGPYGYIDFDLDLSPFDINRLDVSRDSTEISETQSELLDKVCREMLQQISSKLILKKPDSLLAQQLEEMQQFIKKYK